MEITKIKFNSVVFLDINFICLVVCKHLFVMYTNVSRSSVILKY